MPIQNSFIFSNFFLYLCKKIILSPSVIYCWSYEKKWANRNIFAPHICVVKILRSTILELYRVYPMLYKWCMTFLANATFVRDLVHKQIRPVRLIVCAYQCYKRTNMTRSTSNFLTFMSFFLSIKFTRVVTWPLTHVILVVALTNLMNSAMFEFIHRKGGYMNCENQKI